MAPASLAQSASLLIGLQVGARLLTFGLNQLLVRLSDPSVFGAANVQLDLLLSTILFLARDGVRGALIRTSSSGSAQRTRLPCGVHNVALLPIPAGLLIASAVAWLYTARLAPAELVNAHPAEFRASVGLYVLGAVLELLAEPFYIRASVALNVPLRVKAEGAAVIAKGIATLAWLTWPLQNASRGHIGRGLVAFGLGQAAYGAATLLVFLLAHARIHGWKNILTAWLPARPARARRRRQDTDSKKVEESLEPWLDPATMSLTWVLVKQSLLKHLLTESDKLAVARFGSLSDQGGYALASNYGSLVARMLFQPLEESSRIIFSTQLGAVRQADSTSKPGGRIPNDAADASKAEETRGPSANALSTSATMLHTLLHFYALLATFLLTFAPPLATPALILLAGPRWASPIVTSSSSSSSISPSPASRILGAYAGVYLGVMGFNGVLEGFLQATADEAELGTYSSVMLASSAAFVGALVGLPALQARLGADGNLGGTATGAGAGETTLVYANSIALGLRAAWSWVYVLRFVRNANKTTAATVTSRGARPSIPNQDGDQDQDQAQHGASRGGGGGGRGASDVQAETQVSKLHPTAILPSAPTLLTLALAGLYLRYDSYDGHLARLARRLASSAGAGAEAGPALLINLRGALPFLVKGATCGVACLTSVAIFERRRIRATLATLRARRR